MKPRWRWEVALALGALALAPYLAGACILLALGLSLGHLHYGLASRYWQALELPYAQPYAMRIRLAGSLGAAVLPAIWAVWTLRRWRRDRAYRASLPRSCFDAPRTLRGNKEWSVRSVAAFFDAQRDAVVVARRFGVLALHAPDGQALAEREEAALRRYMAVQTKAPGDSGSWRTYAPAKDLLALRPKEQILLYRGLPRPLRCRIVPSRRSPPTPPITSPGDVMTFPKPLAALLASLVAGCSVPAPLASTTAERPVTGVPRDSPDDPWAYGRLGPQHFKVPKTLFQGLHQFSSDGRDMDFILHWPSLEPLPANVRMYRDQDTFLSSLRIGVSYIDKLTDAQYRVLLRRQIEPIVPEYPEHWEHPDENINLRIKGEPVHGLTPYYADFDRIKRYYVALHGPDTRAGEPDMIDDWYVDMGPDGIPRTVLKCSPHVIPDGVAIENGQLRRDPQVFRRATCEHSFLIPEYKVWVNLMYQRAMMSDWRRIEARIRDVLKQGEIEG